jgi:hypothetical protein
MPENLVSILRHTVGKLTGFQMAPSDVVRQRAEKKKFRKLAPVFAGT